MLALGAALTSVGIYQATRVDVSYWARVQVRFMEPLSPEVPNGLESNTYSLIATAGIVQQQMEAGKHTLIVSPDTLLVDTGVRHGTSVILPNSGGQWTSYFANPWLDVQVVGSTPEEVTQVMQEKQDQITATLADLQDDAHVSAPNRIRTQSTPPGAPQVFVEHGAHSRAMAGSFLLGALLTTMLVGLSRRLRLGSGISSDTDPDGDLETDADLGPGQPPQSAETAQAPDEGARTQRERVLQ